MARYYNTSYRMTPAERRARAQQIVQYREERSLLNKYLEEKERAEQLMREQEAARLAEEKREREKNSANFLERGLATVGDLLANIGTGTVKGLEGIADLGLGLVGGIGGIFDDGFEDDIKDIIAKDWTGTYIGEPLQEALRYSYLKDGGIIENVASGLGQMLPAVAVTVATGGGGAGTLAPAAAQALSLGTMMTSAAGNATEEAFSEGAEYWRGLGYGVASGAVEGATEKLLGGATSKIFGAGIFDGVVRSVAGEVAEQGARRVIKDAAGEAFEEALAELVNPALKSIYKGRDAFKEYGQADYWKGVGESALVGGLSSVAFGGTVGRAMRTSGKYADVSGALEANDSILSEVKRLEAAGKYSAEAEAQTARVERANLMNIERVLKNSSEAKRVELMDRFHLEAAFEADGSLKESMLKRLEAKENSATSKFKREYYSSTLRGNEDLIEDDLRAIGERAGVETKVFSGELSEKAQKNYGKMKKALNALNVKSNNNLSMVVTEANDAYKGGLVEDRTMYIPADQLESDDWAGTLVHEFTHFEEGSKEYADMVDFLQSDEILVDDGAGGKVKLSEKARATVLTKDYGFTSEQLDAVLAKANTDAKLTAEESEIYEVYATELTAHETEIVLGNEEFVDRIIAEDGSAAEKLVSRILQLDKGLSSLKDKQARAQAKLIKQAEKLYLKAAEKAGNKRIVKMILAQRPELEEELDNLTDNALESTLFAENEQKTPITGINAEKMHDSEKKVQMDLKDYAEYDKPITIHDIPILRSITRKSINNFTSDDIKKSQKWANKYNKLLGAKSPFFRAWFGEWRSHDKTPITVVPIPSIAIEYQRSKEGILVKDTKKGSDGWKVTISGHGERNTNAHSGEEKKSVASLTNIKGLVENAILLDTEVHEHHQNNAKNDLIAFDHKLYSLGVDEKGNIALYRITVEEYFQDWRHPDEKRFHNLKYIEKIAEIQNKKVAEIPEGRQDLDGSRAVSFSENLATTYSISDLYEFVKMFDEEFTLAPKISPTAAKLLLNKDGTPKVFYHGTRKENGEFWEFDYNKAKKKGGLGFKSLGQGNYFTSNKLDGTELYGSRVIEAYLSVRNPLIMAQGSDFRQEVSKALNQNMSQSTYPSIQKAMRDAGYDGVILLNENGEAAIAVTFDSEQIKSATDNIGTFSKYEKDIRFNLKEKDPLGDFLADDNDGGPVYKVSGGKVRKVIADNTRMKVYTRAESEQIVNQIVSENLSFGELYGSLQGKSRREAIDLLWNGLNSADAGEQGKVALDVAEYIINNAAVESIHDGEGLEVYTDTVALLKSYLHKMDLSSIKSDISHHYGKDSSPYLLWGKRRGEVGLSPDQVAAELSEAGFKIDAENPADIFIQINDAYRDASAHLKKEAKATLGAGLTAEERKKLKQDIAREVLTAFQDGGSLSKFAGIVDRYIKEAKVWRDKYYAEKEKNEAINRTLYKVKKLKDLKTDAFLNASEHKPHLFKGSIESLSRIEVRGNLNKSSTRKIVADLAEWYTRDNPMLEGNNLFDEEVEGMLYVISHGKGQLSTDEVAMLGDVIDYFSHFVENYNKVYRDGKYVDAKPEAERYIKLMRDNERVKVGWFGKVTGSAYLKTFGDPMTVMRRLDLYERGFYTEMMEQLREGAIGASVMEMEIREPLEEFYEKHKKFLQTIRDRKVKYEGFEMTASQAMLYYMTLNRKQALAGLAKSGFAYIDENNKTVRVPGFLKTEGMDKATLESVFQLENLEPAAKAEQAKLYDQFTDAEKQFISIAEKIFNEDCKNAKREVDMKRKGFSNALEDYYVPIRRGNIAKSVDAGTFFDEMNRASNASFNKDTVRGAKNELFIESLDSVLDRHIRGVSQYANLALVIDAYDTIFNLAINDDPNKPETVKTVSENVWRDGAEYFKNVISDIQGIPVESRREGYQLIKQLRSGYAKYQLGANPKVWVTQLSSFAAAGSILDIDSISKGLGIDAKDVDEYCSLAKLRNSENTVAMAQGLFDEHSKPGKVLEATGKFGDVLMTPIGWVDRFVVTKLFGACQVQVAKDGGAKVGTKANKQAAGELLQKVILETQQNATATDRSAAMRSGNELMKTITMFTADSMKVMGRVIDSVGEVSVLKARLREALGQERAELEKRLKTAEKQAARSVGSLVTSAAFMAVVAQLFRTLYNKDDEDENIAANMAVDAAGNLIGGLPIFKDIASFFMDGYGLDNYAYSALNDLLESAGDIFDIVGAVASGELEGRELASTLRKMAYASGQILGLPTRNAYNAIYGLIKRVSPSTAYGIDDMFYNQSYRADLTRAIEKGDDDMIAMIAGIMLDENIGGIADSKSRQELDRLISAGFDVIPRGVADSITYDGEEYVLGASEKKEFKEIYSVANEVLADLVQMSKYKSASDEVKSAAVKYIYKVYWDLALQELVGEDLETKTVLFAEAIPIEKLAMIVATASTLKADTDKSGKAVSGSRKKKIQEYVNSLDLKAVEKYMIMGYLGYKNVKGEAAVKAYINKLRLTKSEREKLIGYSGY